MPDAAELSEPLRLAPEDPPEPTVPEAPRPIRRRRLAAWLRYVLGIGLGALALWAVGGQRGELIGVTRELRHLNWGWVIAAVVAEIVSFAAFAKMQQRLLRAGKVRIRTARVFGLTLAASAIASSIPAGPAFATVYGYRQYRRAGADESIATWGLIATFLCSSLGLALVAAAGVLLAERQGAALDLVGVTLSVLLVVVLALVVFSQRNFVSTVAVLGLRAVKRLTGRPRGDAAEQLNRVARRLNQVHLGFRDIVPALGFSLGNWLFDCGALALSYLAIGSGVPWKGLLLAYGAAQLAANLPITPGGLGVVEGSLTVALVAFGGVQESTVAAVILYRIISFWGFLPVGWLVWAVMAVRDRRHDRALAAASLPPPEERPAVAAASVDRRSGS